MGIQPVGRDGDRSGSLRGNARVGYRLDSGRELSVSYRYPTASLTNSAIAVTGYDYSALTEGVSWAI